MENFVYNCNKQKKTFPKVGDPMSDKIISGLTNYAKLNFQFSEDDLESINYSLAVIFSEFEKLFILFVFFAVLGKTKEFLLSSFTLLLIRCFSGGLHFNGFWKCFFATFIFFAFGLLVLPSLSISIGIQYFLIVVAIVINITCGPIASKSRPEYDAKAKLKFKIISTSFMLLFALLFVVIKNNPIMNYSFWVVILQSFQLFIAKGVSMYEQNKNKIN